MPFRPDRACAVIKPDMAAERVDIKMEFAADLDVKDTPPAALDKGNAGLPSESSAMLKKNEMWCQICGERTKKSNKRAGPCCRKDVEAAEANAKRQGGEQLEAWDALCKGPVDKWRQAILEFKASCPSKGRAGRGRRTLGRPL